MPQEAEAAKQTETDATEAAKAGLARGGTSTTPIFEFSVLTFFHSNKFLFLYPVRDSIKSDQCIFTITPGQVDLVN